jgi:hypothetical protein
MGRESDDFLETAESKVGKARLDRDKAYLSLLQ